MAAAVRNLTPQQADAIRTRASSVALSAGAGCGKTFVLTERFLAELEPHGQDAPTELRELIAITFTERAAREMRDRIRQKTLDRLQSAKDDGEAEYWWRLLRDLDAARVSTIHSFCGTLLRTHAVEAELDPGFQVFEEGQAATLLTELTDDLLREWLARQQAEAMDLIVLFGLSRLRDMLHVLRDEGRPEDWQAWRDRTVDEQLDIWAAFHAAHVVPQIVEQVANSLEAREVLAILTEHEPKGDKMRACRATLLDLLPNLAASKRPAEALGQIRPATMLQGVTSKKDWSTEAIYERYKKAVTALRGLIDKRLPQLNFNREAARPSAEAGRKLFTLAAEVREGYAARKRELSVLDFDDLIAHAHRLLTDKRHAGLRQSLSANLALLLVDEFQDTDPLQVELVKALCGKDLTDGKLFFVGDRKQSIYRFRGAAPKVFRELQETIRAEGRLPLTLNFRSQPAVLDFVNALFVDRFQPDYEKLEASRPQLSPPPAVEFWWSVPQFTKGPAGMTELARRHEADFLARQLRQLFDGQEPVIPVDATSNALRPAQFGDVALLFRALSDVQYYEQALQEYEIPYYLVGGHAFYAQQEIFDVLNLLRAVESVADEVSLAGVLRSPFFSCDDETLFWLAQHPDGLAAGLYAEKLPAQLSPDQRRRAEFAARTLTELRAIKDRVPIAELLHAAFSRTGYDAAILAEFLGERKLANLRKLIEQARSFDRSGVFTLADFSVQLSEFVANQPREALAATHPEVANVVRLMTIHQAKGLEFPIVVVTDLDRPRMNRGEAAAFNAELGPLVKVTLDDQEEEACVGLDMARIVEQAEDQAESDRLFYVAATRAADRLILSSSVFDLTKPGGPWTKLLSERFDLGTGECHAKLPAGYPRPNVAVRRQSVGENQPHTPRRTKVDWSTIVEQAHHLAGKGQGSIPRHAGPILPDLSARRQYSFSRLSGMLRGPDDAPAATWQRGSFDDLESATPRIDPLGLGTLMHAVLADMRFDGTHDARQLVARHAALHLSDDQATADEAAGMIASFADSARAKQLAAAAERHAELEFLLAWPPGAPVADGPFLQGFIDSLYRDAAGAWHLLDYKTNRVTPENLAATAGGYELQMGVYALAVESILGQPPASLTLCFLRAGREFVFPWNAAVRLRTIEQVNQALGGNL